MKLALIDARLINLDEEWDTLDQRVKRDEARRDEARISVDELKRDIAENGGDRIERLAIDIKRKESERDRRRARADRYSALTARIGETAASERHAFAQQRGRFSSQADDFKSSIANLENQGREHDFAFRNGREEHHGLTQEVDSVKARRSNIDTQQVRIRHALCAGLGLREDELSFVGELLQVRDNERDWEGAAERLLRGFGLSLLVPDGHYRAVMDWVDQNQLGGRLVCCQVRPRRAGDLPELHRDSLVRKLSIKPDSPHYDWLERELAHRFDVACCATHEQFRREPRAITRSGQIRDPTGRHEKNDRHPIGDRSRYVLGWSNTAKIAVLEGKRHLLEKRLLELATLINKTKAERGQLQEQLDSLARLDEFSDFEELDWASMAADIETLTDERMRLESASDVLSQLNQRLSDANARLSQINEALEAVRDKRSKIEQRRADSTVLRADTLTLAGDAPVDALLAQRLDEMRLLALGPQPLSVESCDPRGHDVRAWLQARIDADEKTLRRLRDKVTQDMMGFKEQFKLETAEFDANIEAAFEYRALLDRLNTDDLPRFEARFKELLNVNPINEIANFNAQLARERETIKERIARINDSLTQIDYQRGSYILIEFLPTLDIEVRDFQAELRACTEGALGGAGDDQYSETKFLQVKAIIDLFRGREGVAEQDRRWTAKVTDVRNWFLFAASERSRADHGELEHYSDSGGKSGGQKEKLAHTILAASLAYQFGLEWGATRSRSFRFVVIDEAFGRGSDKSAKYGLKLFRQLNLQLLMVTHLQKIHIIEPHVSSVGFVNNADGSASKLRNLTIEEYRTEKALLAG